MRTTCLSHARILILLVFLGAQLPLFGCSDDSKTSGTQVVENPQAAAHRKAKGEAYKGGPLKKQDKSAAEKR